MLQTHMKVAGGLAITLLMAFTRPAAAQFDIVGGWGQVAAAAGGFGMVEDQDERQNGAHFADFLGIPFNDAGRARALSYDGSLLTVPEHQCMPHPTPYNFWGPANLRIAAELDANLALVAYHVGGTFRRADRTIWMDGRPHPPDFAPHTWAGFTTGRWAGNILVTETTHLKAGWVRRNGAPTSDQARVTTFYTKNGSVLTITWIVNDPLFLAEPYIKTTDLIPTQVATAQFGVTGGGGGGGGIDPAFFKCYGTEESARGEEHFVPHYLPWANPYVREYADRLKLPADATQGRAETMYPEFRDRLVR